MIAESRGLPSREAAESLAVAALAWLADDDALMMRFMALSGVSADDMRAAVADSGFLAAVLDFVAGEDATILAFAGHAGVKPERVVNARRILNGHD